MICYETFYASNNFTVPIPSPPPWASPGREVVVIVFFLSKQVGSARMSHALEKSNPHPKHEKIPN